MVCKHPVRLVLLGALCAGFTIQGVEASGRDGLFELLGILHGPQHVPLMDRDTQAVILPTARATDPMTEYFVQRYNGLQGTTNKVQANLVLLGQQDVAQLSVFTQEWQNLQELRADLFDVVQFYKADPEDTLRRLDVHEVISAHAYWGALESTGLFCNLPLGPLVPSPKLSDETLGVIRAHLEDADNLIKAYVPDHPLRFLVARKMAETWARQAQHYHTRADKEYGRAERKAARALLIPLAKSQEIPEEERNWVRLWDAKVVSLSREPDQQKKGRVRLKQLIEMPKLNPRVQEMAARALERLCRLKDGDYAEAFFWDKRVKILVGQTASDITLLTLAQAEHDQNRTEYIFRTARRDPNFHPESVHNDHVKKATGQLAQRLMQEPLPAYATPAWVFETMEAYMGRLEPPVILASSSALPTPDFTLPTPYRLDEIKPGETEPFFTKDELHTIRSAAWKMATNNPRFSNVESGAESEIYVIEVLSRLWIIALQNPDGVPLFFRGILDGWDECPSGDVSHLLNLMQSILPKPNVTPASQDILELGVVPPRVPILQGLQTHWHDYLYTKYHRDLGYRKPPSFKPDSKTLSSSAEIKAYNEFLQRAGDRFATLSRYEADNFLANFHIFAEEKMNNLLAAAGEPPLTEDEKKQYARVFF